MNDAMNALERIDENVGKKSFDDYYVESWDADIATIRAALEAKAEPVANQRVVPVEPTEAQWSGLARDIIMWMDMGGRPTGKSLYEHLDLCGRDIPQWLRDEVSDVNHVPPKGTRAAIIYKAMIMDMPAPPTTAEVKAQALEEAGRDMVEHFREQGLDMAMALAVQEGLRQRAEKLREEG